MAVLAPGSRGTSVADLQRRLEALGFQVGGVDGIYGPQTAAAVRAFQQSRGLSADALYGPETEQSLAGEGAPVGGQVQQPASSGIAAINPENDPQYLAFMRAQGYSDADLRAQIALQRSTIQRNLANELPTIQESQRQQAEQIGKEYLGRGFYGGGEQQRDLAYNAANFGRQAAAAQGNAADQQSALESDLARKLAQGQQQTAEQGLAARNRLATANATAQGGY